MDSVQSDEPVWKGTIKVPLPDRNCWAKSPTFWTHLQGYRLFDVWTLRLQISFSRTVCHQGHSVSLFLSSIATAEFWSGLSEDAACSIVGGYVVGF